MVAGVVQLPLLEKTGAAERDVTGPDSAQRHRNTAAVLSCVPYSVSGHCSQFPCSRAGQPDRVR